MIQKAMTRVLVGIGAACLLAACSESPIQAPSPEEGTETTAIQDISTDGSPISWDVQHSGTLQPWMQYEFDRFQAAVEDVVSGDSDRASYGANVLMDMDPNYYPGVLRALTQGASDEMQQFIEECIQSYWDSYAANGFVGDGLAGDGFAEGRSGSGIQTLGEGTPSSTDGTYSRGPGGEVTYEVDGKIVTAPGSKITVSVWGWGDEDISVAGQTFVINGNESAHTCPILVASSKTTIKGIRVPIKLKLPGWGPVSSITIDVVLIVDITVTLRYYECEGGGGNGDDGDR
ncbi:MAG: hypothetical protein R3E97_22130 [Candidatus Eisenbacteria bacterium]